MRQKILWGVVLSLLCVVCQADDIRFSPGVTVTAAVTLTADANGVLQIDRTKPILIGSVIPSPEEPEDPTDPPPIPDLKKQVQELVKTAPTATQERTAISKLYETTAALPLTDPAQIRQATTVLFDALNLSAEWKEWKEDVDSFAGSFDAVRTKEAWELIAEELKK